MKTNMKEIGLALILALAAAAANAGQTTYYIYDEAGHVIGEYDQNGNPVQEHVYLGDRPLAVVQNGNASAIGYVSTDQQGTPRVITDSQQNVIWSRNSDPYGNGQSTGSITYNLRSAGQYYDAETGHSYNYFRDYDPATGRYIESDPSGLQGGANTYAYVLNNPLGMVDPLGLCGDSPSAPPPTAPNDPTPPPDNDDAHWKCLQNKWANDAMMLDVWAMLYGDSSNNFSNSVGANYQANVAAQGRNGTSVVSNGNYGALLSLGKSLVVASAWVAAGNPKQAAQTLFWQSDTIVNAAADIASYDVAIGQALDGQNSAPPVPVLLPDDQVCPP